MATSGLLSYWNYGMNIELLNKYKVTGIRLTIILNVIINLGVKEIII